MKNVALIVAAGRGARFGDVMPKQYLPLGGMAVLRHSIVRFLEHPEIEHVQVVICERDRELYLKAIDGLELLPYALGGERRQDSVRLGLIALKPYSPANVLIHDAARPMVDVQIISDVIKGLERYDAVDVGVEVVDTLKIAAHSLMLDRRDYYLTQTPQGFNYDVVLKLHQEHDNSLSGAESLTDDISLCIKHGVRIGMVEGGKENLKITTAEDLKYAEFLMNKRYINRVGYGYDIHKFLPSTSGVEEIMLCGVRVPHTRAIQAHSDGDVALHALVDALLGAMGEEDIGMFFPPTDEKWCKADSSIFLEHTKSSLHKKGGYINNVDITIITEAPKLMNYKHLMKKKIAALLLLQDNQVSVKAKTSEKLGFIGREEGIAASAICSIMIPQYDGG